MRGSGRLLLPAIQSQTITGLLLAFSSTAPRAAGLVALVVLRPPPPSHFGGWHSHHAEGIVRCSPRSTAITPALAYAERTSRLAWSSRSRLSTMASQPDSFGFREPSTAAPSRYAQDKSEWKEGSKPGFSVVADYGTADDIEVPADAIETGDGPLRVKLPKLLQLLDPVRFPSSSTAKKKVRQGVVLVNGNKGRVDTDITIGSDHVKLQARTESKFQARGEAPFAITVIYEDDVMAIVHKPPGICTHPPKCLVPQTQAQSMMSMRCCVPYHVPCAPPGSEGILWRPMMAHRLDKDTEGLQLVAKTKNAYIGLQRLFANRLIKKQYLALVEGHVTGDEGTIDMEVDDKVAVSDWKVISRTRSAGLGKTHLTLLHFFPRHGRKHQIRLHCSDGLGHSIVGDRKYRGSLVGHGLFLCAIGVSFKHPITGEPINVTLPHPQRFATFPAEEQAEWEAAKDNPDLLRQLIKNKNEVHMRLSRGGSATAESEEEEEEDDEAAVNPPT